MKKIENPTAWMLSVFGLILLSSCQTTVKQSEEDFTQYVNPFIGAAEYGHCFPGACVPFGLIQVGAETGNCEWKYC